jgi:hypothetical protein
MRREVEHLLPPKSKVDTWPASLLQNPSRIEETMNQIHRRKWERGARPDVFVAGE